ncbi:MAG: hypothetical protein Q9188_003601 [Gyalolechia gomerana]
MPKPVINPLTEVSGAAPSTFSNYHEGLGALAALQQDLDSASSGSDQSSAQEDYAAVAPPQPIENIILESDAWEELREGLMGFLIPILMTTYRKQYLDNASQLTSTLKQDTADRWSQPVNKSLLKVLPYCQAACQTLINERMLSVTTLLLQIVSGQSVSDLDVFSKQLCRIEFYLQNKSIRHQRDELEILLLVEDALTILGVVECRVGNVYTRCFQTRYQQSSVPDKSNGGRTLPFRLAVQGPGLEGHSTCLNLKISSDEPKETYKDFVEIQVLTQQLQTRRLGELAPSLGSVSFMNMCRYGRFMEAPAWLTAYDACRTLKPLTQWWRESGKPASRPGYELIEWQCDCGEKLWGDFRIEDAESVMNFARLLEHPDQQVRGESSNQNTSQVNIGTTSPSTSHPQVYTSTLSQVAIKIPAGSTTATAKLVPLPTPPNKRYLELCVNTGEYDISLTEIHVTTPETAITSDGQLFEEIRKQYNRCRGIFRSHKWSLFKPVDLHFVRTATWVYFKALFRCLPKMSSSNPAPGNFAPVLALLKSYRPSLLTSSFTFSTLPEPIHAPLG